MEPTGLIFAALDSDADAIEEWNEWYDHEHTPMNVCLPGVMLSRRYVATPALHAARTAAPESPFSGGRATFLTTYVLTGDPMVAFDAMSRELPRLYDEGRMRFPADKKTVREGDVFASRSAVGHPDLQLRSHEVPFVVHEGLIVVMRRGTAVTAPDYVAAAEGVLGVWTLASLTKPDVILDLVFVDGDPGGGASAVRDAAPDADQVAVTAPFMLINPGQRPWAEEIRRSTLPRTIA